MKRVLVRWIPVLIVCLGLAAGGARDGSCGTTVSGVTLDTVVVNDDGSRTAVVLYAERTYNVKQQQTFPQEAPRFEVVSVTDSLVTMRPLDGGPQFVLSTARPADE